MEMVTVFVLILLAFMIFQKYFAQAIYGRWRSIGEGWTFGRQYDKEDTTECIYNIWGNSAQWYNAVCFDEQCVLSCLGSTASPALCDTCLNSSCLSNVDGVDVCNQ